ncbi:MAG: hypothetical protein KBD64_00605 [Gammaproteobacteria bacterium]|nr:hypothetical protein [Gammaproteobacteria bacterium]
MIKKKLLGFFVLNLFAFGHICYAEFNPYHNKNNIEVAQGKITKIIVSNENNYEPGFSLCVEDVKNGEVCMWRRSNSFNYQQLLDLANTAAIANKQVIIKSNMVGALDTIILLY